MTVMQKNNMKGNRKQRSTYRISIIG
jgi:hypothetical protein